MVINGVCARVTARNPPAPTTSDTERQSGGDGAVWRVIDQLGEMGEVRGTFQLKSVQADIGTERIKRLSVMWVCGREKVSAVLQSMQG